MYYLTYVVLLKALEKVNGILRQKRNNLLCEHFNISFTFYFVKNNLYIYICTYIILI